MPHGTIADVYLPTGGKVFCIVHQIVQLKSASPLILDQDNSVLEQLFGVLKAVNKGFSGRNLAHRHLETVVVGGMGHRICVSEWIPTASHALVFLVSDRVLWSVVRIYGSVVSDHGRMLYLIRHLEQI